ncbi:MAG: hypothetical protein F4Z06_13015 [Acidimicrobiia bacterium]|nr:hypothetical protein [Acidimicrobiia bacterium]MYE72752.1 hypothetical protein [Acidimicrobiia bacterium]MYJ61879.1 hypothetical protein [Acidimicrobiia bacterium]
MISKRLPTELHVIRDIELILGKRLPPGWSLYVDTQKRLGRFRIDLIVEIVAPKGDRAVLVIEVKRTIEPRLVPMVIKQVLAASSEIQESAVPVVAGAYISPRSRDMLSSAGIGYIDTTGNVHIEATWPGLFISTTGANRDPWPNDKFLQSLRGRGAARAVRAIVDHAPPFSIQELAAASGASAPTISRVLMLLTKEDIVVREPRGPILAVDWQAAIRRWAMDYVQTRSNAATTLLEPRGLPALREKLTRTRLTYAATGAFAAELFDPIAPARTAALYVEDATKMADQLDLRESETGTNVVLLEPLDSVVFDRTIWREGLRCVAPSQLCVDLLTGPGREPSQGEEMLRWMQENEDVWRA